MLIVSSPLHIKPQSGQGISNMPSSHSTRWSDNSNRKQQICIPCVLWWRANEFACVMNDMQVEQVEQVEQNVSSGGEVDRAVTDWDDPIYV